MDAIAQRIFELRGQRVMLDTDFAVLYGVENRALIQAVKRNLERFLKNTFDGRSVADFPQKTLLPT